MTIRIDGDTTFAAELRARSLRATQAAAVATARAAAGIERDAKVAAPVDTGNLRSSISTTRGRGGLHAEVGPTAEYAQWVELGTSRAAAQPFLMPAADRHVPAWVAAMEKIGVGP